MHRGWSRCSAAAALAVAACIDTSAPKGDVVSISSVLLPSPSVVRGDVMRDSAGTPAPMRIVAYDGLNQPVGGLRPEFFVLDRGAHVDTAGMLFGDSLNTIRVVGTLGGLQTTPQTVFVSVAPTKVSAVGPVDTMRVRSDRDTSQNLSPALSVLVTGLGDTVATGFIVHYTVTRAPASLAGAPPTVYIADASGRPMPNDTTDVSGRATRRRAAMRINALGGALDSIIIEAAVLYKGVPLQGSPVRLVFPAKVVLR